jgi:hypothetical protein
MFVLFHKHKLFRNTLIVLLGVAVVSVLVISSGWYPLVLVNETPVFASEYDAAYELSYNYYAYLTQQDRTAAQDRELRAILKPAVLQGLADEILVKKELVQRLGKSELKKKVDEKVRIVWDDEAARAALLDITKAPADDVKKYLLEPEALNQVLDELLRSEGSSVQEWNRQAREQARVRVFARHVEWAENGVKMK